MWNVSKFAVYKVFILVVPPPTVTIDVNANDHVEGQFLDIICSATFSEYVDTNVTVHMIWRRNGTVLANGSDFTIGGVTKSEFDNEYTSVLRVNILRYKADNGAAYNCTVGITPNNPYIMSGNDNSSAITLTVQSK